jgi:hypothetical protein
MDLDLELIIHYLGRETRERKKKLELHPKPKLTNPGVRYFIKVICSRAQHHHRHHSRNKSQPPI